MGTAERDPDSLTMHRGDPNHVLRVDVSGIPLSIVKAINLRPQPQWYSDHQRRMID